MVKTALIHDWLNGIGGGEKVLEAIYSLYPGKIHTLFHDEKGMQGSFFEDKEVQASFLQHMPFSSRIYRNLLPLFPLAIEQFDLSCYDVLLSSSHAAAKGILCNAHQLHICYCHSPMRYAWDLYPFHMKELSGLKRVLAQLCLHSLRKWDVISSYRVDHFIANSQHIARRIKKVYGRESVVIYPPVDVESFYLADRKDAYYITFSRLVPYKRIDLIVEAFSHMPDKKLLVVGDGPEMGRLKKLVGKNVELLGYRSDEELKELVSKARAFLFAAEEDFGICMVEALAAGVPVIAYNRGAAREIIQEGITGALFAEQSVSSIKEAIDRFEPVIECLNPVSIKRSAQRFSKDEFSRQLQAFVEEKKKEFFQ